MKKSGKSILYLIILILVIMVTILIGIIIKNSYNTISKQKNEKVEQLTQTSTDNSYVNMATHLSEIKTASNNKKVIHNGYKGKAAATTAAKLSFTDSYTFEESGQYIIVASIFIGYDGSKPIGTMSFKLNDSELENEVLANTAQQLHHIYNFTAEEGDILSVTMKTSYATSYRAAVDYVIIK